MLSKFYLRTAFIWTSLLLLSCLIPPSQLNRLGWDELLQFDKLLHLTAFAVLVYLWGKAKPEFQITLMRKVLLVVLASAFGLFIELVQQLSWIGRSFEWADLIADTIGAILGVIMLILGINLDPYIKKRLPFIN